MPQFNVGTYQTHIHKPREEYDDGVWGGANEPPRNMGINDMSTNLKRTAFGAKAYMLARGLTNEARSAEVSGREDLSMAFSNIQTANTYFLTAKVGFAAGGVTGATVAVGLRLFSDGAGEYFRRRELQVENINREEERKLRGSILNNNQFKGSFYA